MKKLSARLTDFFAKEPGVALVFVFGSFASGKETEGSDIDIGILFDGPPDFYRICGLKDGLSAVLKKEIDMADLNSAGPVLKMQVLKKGVLVFARDKKIYGRFYVDTLNQYDDLKAARRVCEENILKGRLYAR